MSNYAQDLEEARRLVEIYQEEENKCRKDISRGKNIYQLRAMLKLSQLQLKLYQLRSRNEKDIQRAIIKTRDYEDRVKEHRDKRYLLYAYSNKGAMARKLVHSLEESNNLIYKKN